MPKVPIHGNQLTLPDDLREALTTAEDDSLVPFHRGFDGLDQRRTGRHSGAISTSILRATPGCRRMRPARSKASTM